MRILITGATGLIGVEIIRQCHNRGIDVSYLTTSKAKIRKLENCLGYYWNPKTGEIDPKCLEGVLVIVHLAGSSIFTRWTAKNKQQIIDSRVKGARLLHKTLHEKQHTVGQFVSASGISFYPSSYKKLYFENEQLLADTFLGRVVKEWEAAADEFSSLGLRVAKIRTGIVLSEKDGALPQMQRPIRLNLGSPLGNGKQWQSWIHLEDLGRLYLFVIVHGLEGVFNAASPNPVTNEELMQEIARVEGKKLRLPKVPGFALKLAMGEMANMVLESQLVASQKIQEKGFNFNFVNLGKALRDLKRKEGSN